MATTKPKESSGLGKERRISAPSSVSVPNTPTKRTPKSSPRSPSTDHRLPSSSSSSLSSLTTVSEKHLPNYLKSTASSRHDQSFKQVKKPVPIPENRPNLNRRRSFDKPPPTAPRLEKPFRSPGPRDRASHVPFRSSSFGAKPTTFVSSAKPGFLEKSTSKISKVGKPQQPVQNLKSSNNAKKSLKKEPNNATFASAEMNAKTKNVVEREDQFSLVSGVEEEEIKKIECEFDSILPDPMPELDKETRTDQEETKVDSLNKEEADRKDEVEKKLHHYQSTQDKEISAVVSSKVAEETPPEAETETPGVEDKLLIQEEDDRESNVGAREEAQGEKKAERIAEEKEVVVVLEESDKDKSEEKIVMEEKSETDHDQNGSKGAVLDQKDAQDGQSCMEENNNIAIKEGTMEKEAEAVEKVVVAAGKQRQGGGPMRKESPAVYNDVIEETASKLLETRKNKVKALAGAFQTVIDYESSSK